MALSLAGKVQKRLLRHRRPLATGMVSPELLAELFLSSKEFIGRAGVDLL
jgi:hypothetical protein